MTSAWAMNVGAVSLVADDAAITAAGDLVTAAAHGLSDGDLVMVDDRTGGASILVDRGNGGLYYARNATVNDFQLSATRGGAVIDFASDGTADIYTAVPAYSAVQLRRQNTIHLHPHSDDRLGARSGVRPHDTDPVTVSGTTATVPEGLAVVYPRETATSGAYVVEYDAANVPLDPADGSNGRIDGIDLQVEDDDEDASGDRHAQIVYVSGTPGAVPSEPSVTANSLRLASILVPAGGSPTPSVQTLSRFALGPGVLPVRTDSERPGSGRFGGMMVWRQDTSELEVWDGAWTPIASPVSYLAQKRIATTVRTTNTATFTAETLINTVTADLVAGATYRITWAFSAVSTAAGDLARVRLREDNVSGTVRGLGGVYISHSGQKILGHIEGEFTAASTGAKTFAATSQRFAGTGNVSHNASSNEPHYLYVDYVRG